MKEKPNIILITIDALRADHLGFMGYSKNVSQNLDNLAKDSSVFKEAFSVGPNTPHSFPAILTSTYPLDFKGVRKIERPRKLISEVLKEKGYVTAAFHDNPYLSSSFGYNRGWEYFEYSASPVGSALFPRKSFLSKIRSFLISAFKKNFNKISLKLFPQIFFKVMYLKYKLKVSKEEFEVPAEDINNKIFDFISAQKENSFFLWAHYMDVHSPYFPSGKYESKILSYSDFVAAWLAGYLEFSKNRIFRKFIQPYFKKAIEFYDNGISYFDSEFGKLLDFLKREDIYDDTIIIITADHGEEFLDHGEGFHKPKLYNELLHVPLIIRIPGKRGEIYNKVSLIDIPSTVCSLLGFKEDSFKGQNLFERQGLVFHQTAFGSKDKMNRWIEIDGILETKLACQSKEWKYIVDYRTNKEELYNLLKDPKEKNNLVLERKDILSRLREEIKKFKENNIPLCEKYQ